MFQLVESAIFGVCMGSLLAHHDIYLNSWRWWLIMLPASLVNVFALALFGF